MSECCNAECRYAECCYAACRHAVCRCAVCCYTEGRYAECHDYFECLALERTNVISYEKLFKISVSFKSKSGL